jgi:DNA-binding NarL/FixJ family response regulator
MARLAKSKAGKRKNRIFLVEDHPVFRDGLSKLLDAEEDLTICGEAGDAASALNSIIKLKPDLAVVDIGLPGKSGLDLIKEIRSLKIAVKLLAVSMFDEAIYAQRVLRAGGDGYIMKQEDPEEIVLAIHDVLAGHIYVSEEVLARHTIKQPSKEKPGLFDQLSDTELEVLESLGCGKSTKEISGQLGFSDLEVNEHSESIRRKLKLRSFNALIGFAVCWVEDSRKKSSKF